MSFGDNYHQVARNGDVGYVAYLAQVALHNICDAIQVIADRANVDVASDLTSARENIDILRKEFEQLTEWTAE